jgi:hypothetical protein
MIVMDRILGDITELKQAQRFFGEDISQLKVDIAQLKADMKWIIDTLNDISTHLNSCSACTQSEFIVSQAKLNRDKIDMLSDDVKNTKYIALAISFGVSFIISLLILIGIIKGIV